MDHLLDAATLQPFRHLGDAETGAAMVMDVGTAYAASGVAAYTPEALVSSTRSTAFSPVAGREFYCRISGAGSAALTLVYSIDGGTNYDPQATADGGAAPIIFDKIAYNGTTQNGILLTGQIDKYGGKVAILPGTVTGTVTVEFAQ